MSTLTGNKISLTYKSLIKTADNDVLGAALKELSDGLGNNSGVFLNTGGDLKSTGILEFANFKGTSTSVTINKLVNEADGISNNDNDTSLATSAAVKDYVDTHVTTQDLDFSDGTNPGAVDLDSQVFAIVGTSNEIETSASGQQLQIGLPNDVTISGTYTGTTFSGDLSGTINTATTATTQTAGDNSTKVATTAYVDTLDAASDLDFSDGSTNSAVNLNTQVFSIEGTSSEITTTASGQSLTVSLDSTGVDLPNNSTAITQTAGDNSTKVATTAYVDVLDAASDLDIAGDTGTGDVNLNTQTLTLQGTTNQITTAVSGQTTTFSLPSTVHRNLQGNVTGDLTGNSAGTHTGAVIGNVTGNVNGDVTGNLIGNADTATAWETARDLILSSEATGTISSVDGTQNVTGAVTLLNSAVTGKVLTGLPTPSAGNIQASDTILEAFGKLQSQVSSISNGLIFKGSWDAATNTPTLTSGGGEVDQGTTTGQAANKLIDTSQNFNVTVSVGDKVINQVDGQSALVTVIDSNTQLSLDADIMLSSEAYTIDASPFIQQGQYYVVNYAGTTNLNGITDWSIGDWVIADADNRWSKLDHSQVDGQGSIGHLPVWTTANTLGDSIVSESGTALTVTGSLDTTLGASVTGDFAVNTNKFTVAAASGNTVVAGNVGIGSSPVGNPGTNYLSVGTAGTTAGGIQLWASDSQTHFLQFGDVASGTGYYKGAISYSHSTDTLELLQNAVTALSFTGSQNATFAGTVLIDGVSNYTGLIVKGSGAARPAITWSNVNQGDLGIIYGTENNALVIATGSSGLTALTLDSSQNSTFAGSVGVGGTPTAGYNIDSVRDSAGYSIVGRHSSGGKVGIYNSTGDNGIGTINDYSMNFFTNNSGPQITLNTAGNVGIGNTNPSAFGKFVVEGTGNLLNLNATSGKVYQAFYENGVGRFYLNTLNGSDGLAFTDADGATERMRIDSSGNSTFSGNVIVNGNQDALTINTTDTDGPYAVWKNTTNATLGFVGNANSLASAGNTNFAVRATNDLIFASGGGTERMRIDSSGIVKIYSGGGTSEKTYTATAGLQLYSQQSDSGSPYTKTSDIVANGDGTVPSELRMFTKASGSSTPTERMRIDSSGRVGIGVTPYSWSTSFDNIQIGNKISLWSASNNGGLSYNQYYNGTNNIYQTNDTANRFQMDADGFHFYQAGSGTAGQQATFSESMRLSSTGNLLINNTAGVAETKLVVEGSSMPATGDPASVEDMLTLYRYGSATVWSGGASLALGRYSTGGSSNPKSRLDFKLKNIGGTNTALPETTVMTMQSNGAVGIGTDSPSSEISSSVTMLEINDTTNNNLASLALKAGTAGSKWEVAALSSNSLGFIGAGTERMRIASTGNLLFGINDETSEPTNKNFFIADYQSGASITIGGHGGTHTAVKFRHNGATTPGTIVITSTTTSYNTSSDYRLKEDLQDFTGLDMVSKIPVYDFKWKTDESRSYGVMAHELQEVLPDAVSGDKDAEEMQGVDYSKIVPLLVKSIQELKAEVDLLKQECKCK